MDRDAASRPSLGKRRVVCENSRFEVFLDDVQSENGDHIRNYLVVAPKMLTGDLIAGVAVLPIVDDKIGLLRIYRHAIQCYLWEIPRGFVDPAESDRSAALRELEEETGLACAEDDLESLAIVAPEPGILAARAHLFVACRCKIVRPFSGEEFGHIDFRLFDPAQVLALHRAGEIQDSTTLLAYCLHSGRLTG
jgi:8-oxo-dGTP pyrophosphatase MutT (NUDIX family)